MDFGNTYGNGKPVDHATAGCGGASKTHDDLSRLWENQTMLCAGYFKGAVNPGGFRPMAR